MLNRKDAQKQLAGLRNQAHRDARLAAAKKLAGPSREAALAILEYDAGGNPLGHQWSAEKTKAETRSLEWLEKASAKERGKVFRALFDDLADAVEHAWQFVPNLTYQIGYVRKPFRAPGADALFRARRLALLRGLGHRLGDLSREVMQLPWLAAWAPHLGYGVDDFVAVLFSADINAGNTEVFDILVASAKNEHEIGAMGRHVTRALLNSSKPEAWQFVENLLLAAQRQEGLRQVILEAIDEANPQAFRRMLRVMIDNDLIRFSATARAINVWFGFQWDSISTGAFNKILTQIVDLLDDPAARSRALAGDDPEAIFYALWAIGHEDAMAALEQAGKVLKDKKPERRFAALTLIGFLDLPESRLVLLNAMDDDDLRIAVAAHRAYKTVSYTASREHDGDQVNESLVDDHLNRLHRLVDRMPAKKSVAMKPLIWPWTALSIARPELIGDLVASLGERSLERVIGYRDEFDKRIRQQLSYHLATKKKWDALERQLALEFAGDASVGVRQSVLAALAKTKIAPDEAELLESYLSRKVDDLRRGAIGLLLSQKDAAALASADRLLASKDGPQRLAGLELLRQLKENDRQENACRARAAAYREARRTTTKEEKAQLDAILADKQEKLALDDALGLMNPAERTKPAPPRVHKVQVLTSAAIACLKSLDDFVAKHRDEEVVVHGSDPPRKILLGNVASYDDVDFPWNRREHDQKTFTGQEWFEKWNRERPAATRDRDGLELERLSLALWNSRYDYEAAAFKAIAAKYPSAQRLDEFLGADRPLPAPAFPMATSVLAWLTFLHPKDGYVDFVLDVTETMLALIPVEATYTVKDIERLHDWNRDRTGDWDWRSDRVVTGWLNWLPIAKLSDEQFRRRWNLCRWIDIPCPDALRHRCGDDVLVRAFQLGLATEADVVDQLLGPRHADGYYRSTPEFESVRAFTARKPSDSIANEPKLLDIAERVRTRLFEIEMARGETETPASAPALHVAAMFGLERLVALLQALAKTGISRGTGWRGPGTSKPAVLSHLAGVMFPTEADTPAAFAKRMKTAVADGLFPEERLLELAFHAPQWTAHIEAYFAWPGFQEGVWWFLAHMGAYVGDLGDIDAGAAETPSEPDKAGQNELSPWEKIIRQRTPLTWQERQQGAIDMAWFRRVHEQLGDEIWRRLGETAKWGATSHKARKALHLGDVILGNASRKEMIAEIRTKYRKEPVRLLGILPLAAGAKRDVDVRERYNVLVEYRRYAKGLSAMTKPIAMQSAQIGLDNLARTAGYADPLRLEWAMEVANLADLAKGPVQVVVKGVAASLFLDDEHQPQLIYEKDGKPLKSLPADLKKNAKIAELIERRNDLKRQAGRIRESLEAAMCRGDLFAAAEVRELASHPLLAPMLERLVLVGDGVLGYLAKKGQALRRFDGTHEPIKKSESLRLAHPFDLYESGQWHDWQHECFQAERVQPFKQVFRELYLVTKQERKDGTFSLRYDGQQVQPRQATALFNARGWTANDGIWKSFHELKLTANVFFKFGWGTALEVEGWTLAGIDFRNQEDGKPLALDKVPPRVFSEAMRDLDLVVSVAHRGGVDPEASASTVEMRESLLRETCSLLGITNYSVKSNHVLIDGELGNYSVHLGSAVAHRRPGGAVCIIPVHAQHRGRLFLPFADNDPKTAEVLTKVLLLARDREIQDPTILEQLR